MKNEGVSAVALGREGEVYLLDRANRRVLRVAPGPVGDVALAAQVPEDGENLDVGPDNALAVHSPLRARVWLYDNGELAGELPVPRTFRRIRGIALGPSRVVSLYNAFQETFTLGSPAAPLPLGTVLHTSREGEHLLGDGRGVAVRLTADARPEVLLLTQGPRTRIHARHTLPEQVLAARVVGAAGSTICLRLEQQAEHWGDELLVDRKAVCLGALSGERLLERDLSRPGSFVPRRELALGGDPLRLAFIRAEEQGLRLMVWPVPAAGKGVAP
jgi:hypothetical protein